MTITYIENTNKISTHYLGNKNLIIINIQDDFKNTTRLILSNENKPIETITHE